MTDEKNMHEMISKLNDLSQNFKINLPKLDMAGPINATLDAQRRMEYITEQMVEERQERENQEIRYREESLELLRSIEKNTGDISALVNLVQTNNDKQQEILDVITSIMEISRASTTEEADSLYRNVMTKAQNFNDDVETATTLWSYGKVVWLAVKAYIVANQ